MLKIVLTIAASILSASCFFSSCRHTTDEHGIPQIVQHRYWNYYERGIAYSIVKEWEKASDDFKVAMGLKEGALFPEYEDMRRNKTYGLLFIDNYFPHRELGICYFFTGNMIEAEKELELSLEMTPSARAKFYLNKVQSASLSKLDRGTTNPIQIEIDFPESNLFINRTTITVKGVIQSPFGIQEVYVNKRRELIELASEIYDLNSTLSLEPGQHTLAVATKDLAGNSKIWKKNIIIDVESPLVSFSPSDAALGKNIVIKVADDQDIDQLKIDGRIQSSPEVPASHSIEVPVHPYRKIKLEAIDKAGNRTRAEIDTENFQQAALHIPKRLSSFEFAALPVDPRQPRESADSYISDINVAVLPQPASLEEDRWGPKIFITPEILDAVSVTTSDYVLDVAVEDDSCIESIVIAVHKRRYAKALGEDKKFKYCFTRKLALKPGENHILIRAEDRHGNTTVKKLQIDRKIPFDQFQKYRMTMASHISTRTQSFLNNQFFNRIYKKKLEKILSIDINGIIDQVILGQSTTRFNIIERDMDTVNRLLFEQKIAHSRLKDYRYALEEKKMRNAEWFLRGSISLRGGSKNENWVLDGALIDVQDGTQLVTSDAYFEGATVDEVEYGLRLFVDKLVQQLPLYSTAVSKIVKSNKVIVPLGSLDNIKPNFRFMFVSQNEKNVLYADPMSSNDGKWIQGVAASISDSECVLEISPKNAVKLLKKNDTVFLR